MAIGGILRQGVKTANNVVNIASVKAWWFVCHDNLEAAAETTGLLQPYAIATSAFHWVKVPDGATRVLIRARNDAAATTFTTSPVVRIIGMDGTPTDAGAFTGTTGDANFGEPTRLDNVDANATGVTLTLAATLNLEDGSYEYSDPPDLTGYDLKGCSYVGMAVETAANVTGGALNGVVGQMRFLN